VARAGASSLEGLATENVIEGCVRETYGALVASHQAATATDPEVRALMTDIARDEMNHATLSWQVDAWASSTLGPTFRGRRSEAARVAIHELASTAQIATEETIRTRAGLPASDTAALLLGASWASLRRSAFFS
jgi:hypothetical protein